MALAAAVVAGGAAVACVLADPPAEIPQLPPRHPVIERELVFPPVTQILETWPTEFDLVVDAFDTASIFFEVYYDDTSIAPVLGGQIDSDPLDAGMRFRALKLQAPPLGDCHVIEILVARSFSGYRPDSYGGDSVVWFYSPSGSLSGCGIFDAGVDASDAGSAVVGDAGGP
jgi:hypothetical protein